MKSRVFVGVALSLVTLSGCSLFKPAFSDFTFLQCAADMGVEGTLRVVGQEANHPVLIGAYVDKATSEAIHACYAKRMAEGDD